MPLGTPFHARAAALSETHEWRNWAGWLAAATYGVGHEPEYYAIRNAAALIDVSPLYKYEIKGSEAAALLDRVVTRDIARQAVGQVVYTTWCDDDGKVIDDGTVQRLAADRFRLTAADPSLRWLQDCGVGMAAEVRDVSTELAALAIQGPRSRQILEALGLDLSRLAYFHLMEGMITDIPVTVTRTGYTGDLGYELWFAPVAAEEIWDLVVAAGTPHGLLPAGMVPLDLARIEAGLVLIEVDYLSSRFALIAAQQSSPYELGLGWTVKLDKVAGDFVGCRALRAEAAARATPGRRGASRWSLVGIEVGWDELKRRFAEHDLPPMVAGRATRGKIPLYHRDAQVGYVTSLAFSPLLKRYVGLATVALPHAAIGSRLEIELTVEQFRKRAAAVVVKTPFFDPARKRSLD